MSDQVSYTIEEYRVQREYREEKRKEYLKRFEVLKQKLLGREIQVQKPQQMTAQKKEKSSENGIQQQLLQENKKLKGQMQNIEKELREEMTDFKGEISVVKEKYIEKIKQITQGGKRMKEETNIKIAKISEQMKNAVEKNNEIKKVNEDLEKEIAQSQTIMEKYTTEIRNEYGNKLSQFEKIFQNSNQKIEAMEAQINDQEFVKNTLENEQLIISLKENTEKAGEDIDKILSDFSELLEGKREILSQINSNNQMKEREIGKMNELEGKLKVIFQKLNEEKKIYVQENNKLTQELMQIKVLLMSSMENNAE